MDNFNLKKFLIENKLTRTSVLREGVEDDIEQAIKDKKIDPKKVKDAAEKAEKGKNSKDLAILMATANMMKEAKKKKKKDAPKDEEIDLDLDTETPEGNEDIDFSMDAPAGDNLSTVDSNVKAIQDALTQAQNLAQEIGDEALVRQVNNTITMVTRDHIANKKPIANKEPEPIREYFYDDEDYEEGANNQYVTNDENGWELNKRKVEKYVESTSDDSDFASDFAYSDTLEEYTEETDNIENLTDREIEKMINNAMDIFIEQQKELDRPSDYYNTEDY